MKTLLVTGGSRGIGAGIVRRFSQEGWRVAFGYHQNEQAAQAVARATGAYPLQADLKQEHQLSQLYGAALRQLSHLDTLIVNAGMAWSGLLQDMPTRAWDDLMALNLRSAFLLSRLAIPGMVARGSGSILYISSIHGVHGASCEAAYAASKAGLIGLARSLAAELGPCGIRVNCLAPGVIDTDMMAHYSPADKEVLQQQTPLQRLGTAEDVADAAFYLCSDEAGYITGQVLQIDGGLVL